MVGRTKITNDTAALSVDHLEERSALTSQLGELDVVAQDRVIEVLDGIEKTLWMFEADRPTEMI
ncbi:MAG: hypothetical protein ACRDIY_02810 [Chloroflexota bacterium]